jgi:hypothetical protein
VLVQECHPGHTCEERVSVFIDRVIKEHKSNSLSSGKCILKLE